MDKSPDAFRTISEVAEDLDLPQHVLRFWETRFTQIKPLKRGGGRRYYRPDDVALIMGLKSLLYGQGYTIKGVQRILKEQGVRHVQAIGRGQVTPAPAPAGEREAEAAAADAAAPMPPPASAPASPNKAPSAPRESAEALRAALTEIARARDALARALRPAQDH